jgi:hypothetical protein
MRDLTGRDYLKDFTEGETGTNKREDISRESIKAIKLHLAKK